MTEDVKPSDAPQSELGIEPIKRSAGLDTTLSDLIHLLHRQQDTIQMLVAQNQDLIAMVTNEDEEEDQGLGRDMAGNPIKVS